MKPSSLRRAFARRALIQLLVFATLLFAIGACLHWGSLEIGSRPDVSDYGAMLVFLLLFGLLQWFFLKNTLARLLDTEPAASVKKPVTGPTASDPGIEREKRINEKKRLFVHLFAALQREGRLMDFFHEDLDRYEDDQIGAAVRRVHEQCRRTVERYLAPEPVMHQHEGEIVQIDAGFDRQAITLVGNVGSQPPFKGIVRHRGWQSGPIALPELSAADRPDVIAPAEIEIQ